MNRDRSAVLINHLWCRDWIDTAIYNKVLCPRSPQQGGTSQRPGQTGGIVPGYRDNAQPGTFHSQTSEDRNAAQPNRSPRVHTAETS